MPNEVSTLLMEDQALFSQAGMSSTARSVETGLLRASLDAQPVAMAMHGADSQAIFLNRAAHRLLRADPDAVAQR